MYAAARGSTGLFVVDINCAKDPVKGRTEAGLLKAFAVDDTGGLRLVNSVGTHGVTPCHCWLASKADGDFMLVANYGDELSATAGSIASFRVRADGGLTEAISVELLPGEVFS